MTAPEWQSLVDDQLADLNRQASEALLPIRVDVEWRRAVDTRRRAPVTAWHAVTEMTVDRRGNAAALTVCRRAHGVYKLSEAIAGDSPRLRAQRRTREPRWDACPACARVLRRRATAAAIAADTERRDRIVERWGAVEDLARDGTIDHAERGRRLVLIVDD